MIKSGKDIIEAHRDTDVLSIKEMMIAVDIDTTLAEILSIIKPIAEDQEYRADHYDKWLPVYALVAELEALNDRD